MSDLQSVLEQQGNVSVGWVENVLTPKMQLIAQQVCRAAQVCLCLCMWVGGWVGQWVGG